MITDTVGIIDDPWVEGKPRLGAEPLVLSTAEAGALAQATCAVAQMIDTVMMAAWQDDDLLARVGLDPSLMALTRLDGPRWLALARADVFRCTDGVVRVCELNSDAPTGLAECVILNAGQADSQRRDPAAGLQARWTAMVRAAVPAGVTQPWVGVVDPTEMTEDLCHIRLLTRWLEDAGFNVVRGSPFNLHGCADGRIGLFDQPFDVLLRLYKTDWWAARRPLWKEAQPPRDAAPLMRELALVAGAMAAGKVGVVNPWGTALAQNKRVLALPWEMPSLFPAEVLAAAQRALPESRFRESLSTAQLVAERQQWVLKSDYGCEGDEVFIGAQTPPELWASALERTAPGRWMVQRMFVPQRDAEGREANYGVFLIGGRPSGIYTRLSQAQTDHTALSVPTLVAV